jgi:hypothetical protein
MEAAASTNGGHRDRVPHDTSVSRDANERILAIPNRPPAVFELFICECSLERCTGTVSLTVSEFEDIRRHPSRFAVAPGHVDPDVECVVDAAGGRYEVVQKLGRTPRAPGV